MTSERKLTPMMQQYEEMKAQYPDAVLFFRMGDFYEMFGQDAVKAAPILDVVLTSRDKNAETRMPMCGVPHHSVNTYIARLIEKNMKVAICEQLEDPRYARGIVKRGVTRLITPGTILEDNLLTARENNYLASVFSGSNRIGLAFLDMSTGEFKVTEVEDRPGMLNELDRWSVREILYPESDQPPAGNELIRYSPVDDWVYSRDYCEEQIREVFQVSHLDGLGLKETPSAVMASGALLHYVRGTHIDTLSHITRIQVYHDSEYVHLDSASRRNLEISRTLMGFQREGSLLHYLDLTMTPMGSRMLKQRLEQPLRNMHTINERLDLVEGLYDQPGLRMSLRDQLSGIADMERLISRITTGIAHPRDLAALRASLAQLPSLKLKLESSGVSALQQLGDAIDPVETVREFLDEAIMPEPPATLKDGGVIRDGYDPELDTLRTASRDGKKWIAGLQAQERERTGINSLKVRYNKVFGYFIEVTKTHLEKIPEDYIRKQTLVNSERFITPDLKEMEEKILGAEDRMIALEQEIFRAVRTRVSRDVFRIQRTSEHVASLDVAAAAAELAVSFKYRRPVIEEGSRLEIRNGRHPVVERIPTDRGFVPNDTVMDTDEHRLMI
ncbi:MAG TPA: DNA mismatch repair protein MutS, partial [bacterium]|nr:DNA mismatch repair protein MutS [bacterium]